MPLPLFSLSAFAEMKDCYFSFQKVLHKDVEIYLSKSKVLLTSSSVSTEMKY